MSHGRLFRDLGDKKDDYYALIHNITNMYDDTPYLMREILELLDDDSVFYNMISEHNRVSLCALFKDYFTKCWGLYLDNTNLRDILEFGKIEIYRVDAKEGMRYATRSEVKEGVRGLIGEYIYPAEENTYRLMCLLQWTLHGTWYFFKEAGYTLNYNIDGKVTNTFYEMILMCANQLVELLEWLDDEENLTKAINKLKKMKRSGGYKYADYASDEIHETIPIKQITLNILDMFPRNSSNVNYRRAIALSLKSQDNRKKLLPSEVSWMRDTYAEYINSHDANNRAAEVNDELKSKCEKLLEQRFRGAVNQKHFAFTIIETLKKNNYTKCSPKQYNIIDEAYKQLKLPDENGKSTLSEVISDDDIESAMSMNEDSSTTTSFNDYDASLLEISDAIGEGLFED